jgi:hypothetical protein
MSRLLKDCPFCKGRADIRYAPDFAVFCRNCDATITGFDARDKWNTRDGKWE